MKVTLPFTLEDIYGPIAKSLETFEELYHKRLVPDNDKCLGVLVDHAAAQRGKRLRPALVLLAAEACGGSGSEQLVIACAIEAMHVATLVHDDVLDEAELRRRQATVNANWGNVVSVLLGDFLFSRSFVECARMGDVEIARRFSATATRVCEGELLQIAERHNADLGKERYMHIIDLKTASLTAFAAEVGALLSGAASEVCRAMHDFGHHLGMAFQITDDCLDIVGVEKVVGKSLGTDLQKGKVTLPIIRLLEAAPRAIRNEAAQIIRSGARPGDRARVEQWLTAYGCLEYAGSVADESVSKAVHSLQVLPAGRFRDSLEALAQFVTRREL